MLPMVNIGISCADFVTEYSRIIRDGHAALFVGAGLSCAAGVVDWKGLLAPLAQELGLEIRPGADLIALAQYHFNHVKGRAGINQELRRLVPRPTSSRRNHELIAALPILNLWTTNYDTLLEDALRKARRKYCKKSIDKDVPKPHPGDVVVVHKMHGDISSPQTCVLTKEDYELYPHAFPNFVKRLHSDLLTHSFLFLGFSFADPNLNYFLSSLRQTAAPKMPRHFWITRREQLGARQSKKEHKQALREQQLRIEDLKRYGIQTVLIDDYAQITEILDALRQSTRGRYVFVSGSAADHAPLGSKRLVDLTERLGRRLIQSGYHLLTAEGKFIGKLVASSALEQAYASKRKAVHEQLTISPFPQITAASAKKRKIETTWRQHLLERAGFAIFVSGNKQNAGGKTIVADGVLEEYRISRQQTVFPIPIGASGYAAAEIWKQVDCDFADIFPPKLQAKLRRNFNLLNDAAQTPAALVNAALAIMRLLTPATR